MPPSPFIRCGLLLVLLLAAQAAMADPAPVITGNTFLYLRHGESREVTLPGQYLASCASVASPNPRGLSVTLLQPVKPSDSEVGLKLSATADAPPGDREVRVISPGGVSAPLTITVGQFPLIEEKEPNDAVELAQGIQLPAVVTGRIDAPGDSDFFRFNGTQGQRVLFCLHARRLGSPLEPLAVMHQADGRELPLKSEEHDGDVLYIFDVPASGDYVLELRDLRFRGGPEFSYRFEAGSIPYLESLIPMSAPRGKVIEVRAIGHNLEGSDTISLDLTSAQPGRLWVRARTPLGLSNELPFEVTDLPSFVEKEPNDLPAAANVVPFPCAISGAIDQPRDEDCFRFHLDSKLSVSLDVQARQLGSSLDALLTLRAATGDVIETNNGSGRAEARIARELGPGDYVVSVRDLSFDGGPSYGYRLLLQPMRLAGSPLQDFAVRFLPDSPRVCCGGRMKLWCEVTRQVGFRNDVTVSLEGLPPGVTCPPLSVGEKSSGIFVVSATRDAAMGSFPIRLKATAGVGTELRTHYGEAEFKGRPAQQAYLTVLEAAPFSIEPLAPLTPLRVERMSEEVSVLAARMARRDSERDAAQNEWEKRIGLGSDWLALEPATVTSATGTRLSKQPDGSLLASGTAPGKDTYTLTAKTKVKGITGFRLEVLADPSLPGAGPGVAPDGNFVLTQFKVTAAAGAEAPQPVVFSKVSSDFAQAGFPAASAIDEKTTAGWAIASQSGKDHWAVFEAASPIGADDSDEETTLTFVLEHQSAFAQHNLGRFRISMTTADVASVAKDAAAVLESIEAIARIPAEHRTPEERAKMNAAYRSTDPLLVAEQSRLDALRSIIVPYTETARLESLLSVQTPQLDADQARWEESVAAGGDLFTVFEPATLKAANGSTLEKEPDGSIFVSGVTPPQETFTLTGPTALKGITAVRLEVLPDPHSPKNGPGRAADGNFILSGFRLAAAPASPATQPATSPATAPATAPAPSWQEWKSAKASFEQKGFPVAGAIDDRNDTGWAISPNAGKSATATFLPKMPIGPDGISKLTVVLEHLHPNGSYVLGRYRIWLTAAKSPQAAPMVPPEVMAILKVAPPSRDEPQRRELAAFYRSIAPSLQSARARLKQLTEQTPAGSLVFTRGRAGSLPLTINRDGFAGEIQLSLEGFTTGRDASGLPMPITPSLKVSPLSIGGQATFGLLSFRVEGGAELGTRLAVVRAEAKVGNDTLINYSEPFPITIHDK